MDEQSFETNGESVEAGDAAARVPREGRRHVGGALSEPRKWDAGLQINK